MLCGNLVCWTHTALSVTFWSPYRKGQTWGCIYLVHGEQCGWKRSTLKQRATSNASRCSWLSSRNNLVLLEFQTVIGDDPSSELVGTGTKPFNGNFNRKSVLGENDCTRDGAMCWQFERCFEHNAWQMCQPMISCAVPGPEGSDGARGKLLQADQHNSLLVLLLNFCLSFWEAEGNSVLEELHPSFWPNRMS